MSQTLWSVGLFVLLVALAPSALKKWQSRRSKSDSNFGLQPKVIAAIQVGPQQRVVTVEIVQGCERIQMVLGVTTHSITFLHSCKISGVPIGSALECQVKES